MSDEETAGLTGVWDGQFSYPTQYPPTAFTAVLLESGGAVSGSIHELCNNETAMGQTLTSTLSGQRAGSAVTFNKIYDRSQPYYDQPVIYEGVLSADGLQIEGTWRIPGVWAARFVMIRNRRARATVKLGRKQSVPVA